MKDKKAACFLKQILPCFFVQKLCWLCYSQIALSYAGCHLQVAISCAQKSFKKVACKNAVCKNVDEIDPGSK
jgi:hypothetical protein